MAPDVNDRYYAALAEGSERAKPRKARPSPLSLRLSLKERVQLKRGEAGMPLGSYIKDRLFDDAAPKRGRRGRTPVKDHEALARVLAALGRSELCASIQRMAGALQDGRRLSAKQTAALDQACANIAAIRADVIAALGIGLTGEQQSSVVEASED